MKRCYDSSLFYHLINITDVENLGDRRTVSSIWRTLLLRFRTHCLANYPRDTTRCVELLLGTERIRSFVTKCKEHFLSSCTLADDPASMRVMGMLHSGNWPTRDEFL